MSPILNFRSNHAIDDATLRAYAPSIFTEEPHPDRTDSYRMLPTYEVINGLRANGFLPVSVQQMGSRLPGRGMFTKHLVRFRPADKLERVLGENVNEIILTNSHDGSSSYEMMAGVYRFVCLNGMVVGSTSHSISVPHRGDVVSNVIEGATRILADFELIDEAKDAMRSLILAEDEQIAFAGAALQLRYLNEPAPITAESLLATRRFEDNEPTLWNTFNTVQENMVKGGLRGVTALGRRMTTRGITGLNSDLAVNRMLWNLAEAARNMKQALPLDLEESLVFRTA